MIWFGIIAIIFYGVGIIIRDSHMGNPLTGKFGKLLYYVSLIMFAILVIISIIEGIKSL